MFTIPAVARSSPPWSGGPGPVLFLNLAIMVGTVPGRFMIWIGVVLSAAFVVGALTNPEPLERLSTPSDLLGFSSTLLQLVGLCVAVGAGAVATLAPRGEPAPGRDSIG